MTHPECAYSKGQRLVALLLSFQLGTTVRTELSRMRPEQSSSWDGLAESLHRQLVESIGGYREAAR